MSARHQYAAVFTRYFDCDRQISWPVDISAKNFDAAVARANDILAGMKYADPRAEFAIVSVGSDSYGGEPANPRYYDFSDIFAQIPAEDE